MIDVARRRTAGDDARMKETVAKMSGLDYRKMRSMYERRRRDGGPAMTQADIARACGCGRSHLANTARERGWKRPMVIATGREIREAERARLAIIKHAETLRANMKKLLPYEQVDPPLVVEQPPVWPSYAKCRRWINKMRDGTLSIDDMLLILPDVLICEMKNRTRRNIT